MRNTCALAVMALAACSCLAASDDQQAVLANALPPKDTTLVAVDQIVPVSPPATTTRCPHQNPTTLFTSRFAPTSSTSQSPTSQPTETATEGELNDEGAAGSVAKASLFPLVVGLAAAVVML